jgi:manganese/iron transport system ATP-binding protein
VASSGSSNSPYAIEVDHLTVSYAHAPALLDISFRIAPGELTGVIGPNGSGKSTLLKALLGFAKPDVGEIRFFGKPAHSAKGSVAYVPQRGVIDWDFPVTVGEVALMGRYGHIPWYREISREDRQKALESLETVKMAEFRDRQIGQLSGGQQQRVFLARAMAQGAPILLLDEPFAGVDAATERALLEVLGRMREAGRTLLVVHHDLTSAAEYFDTLLLLKQRLYAFGPPEQVLRPQLLDQVYDGKLRSLSAYSSAPSSTGAAS